MGRIYEITNSINGKSYIGQTTRSLKARWREHLRNITTKDYTLYRAMRKYGRENFYITQIEECPDELLNEREIYWIAEKDTYHHGYNATLGGDGVRLDDYSYKYIPVVQFDKQGNKIADYESALVAERATGISRAAICCVCKGTYQSVHGYQWRYKKDEDTVMAITTVTKSAPRSAITQFALDGHRIRDFESLREAGRVCGTGSTACIRKCLAGQRQTAHGYQWRFTADVEGCDHIPATPYSGKGGRPFAHIMINRSEVTSNEDNRNSPAGELRAS